MKRFKVGQTVYYYLECDGCFGKIIECVIKQATKDLSTGKITYVTGSWSDFTWVDNRRLDADQLYASKKQILKEHRDEIAYGILTEKLSQINSALEKIIFEYADNIKMEPSPSVAITTQKFGNGLYVTDLYVNDIGNVKEELAKITEEIEGIKKKIKKPTKKSVKKKENKIAKAE